MKSFGRRHFLGSSSFVLGSTLMDALATPLWRWQRGLQLQSKVASPTSSAVQFVDAAREAGLNIPNVWGAADRKRYIIEAKGSGIAFFDYDNDGWLDVYLTNGTRLGAARRRGDAVCPHRRPPDGDRRRGSRRRNRRSTRNGRCAFARGID